jgi:hypothetical protein
MTVKELALFTGKTERTIRAWIAKADNIRPVPHETISQGIAHNYSIDEVELILNAGSMSKDAVRILMENARKPIATLEVQTAPNQMDVLFAFMERQQHVNQEFMKTVLSELKGIKQPLQIEQPKQDYYSLVAYCSLNKIKTVNSELRKMGMDLRKMTAEAGKELHKVPDERWGEVNSYPLEILEEYFSE